MDNPVAWLLATRITGQYPSLFAVFRRTTA
jgi:hypothetical protein